MSVDLAGQKPSQWRLWVGIVFSIIFVFVEFQEAKRISKPYFIRLSPSYRMDRIYHGITPLNHGFIDGSDRQYINFRLNIVEISLFFALLAVGRIVLEQVYKLIVNRQRTFNAKYKLEEYVSLLDIKSIYYTITGLGFVAYLHAGTIFYFLPILCAFYWISCWNGSSKNPYCTWIFALVVLVLCDVFNGFRIFNVLLGEENLIALIVDGFRGRLPWHLYYKVTMLKAISFNVDKCWAYRNTPVYQTSDPLTKRVVTHQSLDVYKFHHFLGYTLYAPLYIAGPITGFNAFISQLQTPTEKPDKWRQLIYTGILIVFVRVLSFFSDY